MKSLVANTLAWLQTKDSGGKYLFRTTKIPIVSAIKVYKNQEGAIPAHVYVLKYNDEKKEKKITFYCNEKEFKKNVEPWLISKKIKITKRWK